MNFTSMILFRCCLVYCKSTGRFCYLGLRSFVENKQKVKTILFENQGTESTSTVLNAFIYTNGGNPNTSRSVLVLLGFLVMLDFLLFSIPTRPSRSGEGVAVRVIRPTPALNDVKTTQELEGLDEQTAVKGFADDNENIVEPRESSEGEEIEGIAERKEDEGRKGEGLAVRDAEEEEEGLAEKERKEEEVREEEGEEGSEESWLEELQRRVADRIPTAEEELAEEAERERVIESEVEEGEVEEGEEASEESVGDVEESREEGWEKKEDTEVD
jgi:hypothetical protein